MKPIRLRTTAKAGVSAADDTLRQVVDFNKHQRDALGEVHEDLQVLEKYLSGLVVKGVETLNRVYETDCTRFEAFIEPQHFDELINEVERVPLDAARAMLEFERTYTFLSKIIKISDLVAQAVVGLKRLSTKSQRKLPSSWDYQARLEMAQEETKALRAAVNKNHVEKLKFAHSSFVCDFHPDYPFLISQAERRNCGVDPNTIEEFKAASASRQEQMIEDIFPTIWANEGNLKCTNVYENLMRTIRVLGTFNAIEDLTENMKVLPTVIARLETMLADNPAIMGNKHSKLARRMRYNKCGYYKDPKNWRWVGDRWVPRPPSGLISRPTPERYKYLLERSKRLGN